MIEHYAIVEEARAVVEKQLRAWEIHDQVRGNRDGISFVYEDAQVVDRNPPPPGCDEDYRHPHSQV